VTKLETDDTGNRVSEVIVDRGGETERYTADLVVLACGAANTAKLLLQSANDRHPNGIANGSDQVGRNYMFHDSLAVLALSREENPTVFQKTLGLNDFYFGTSDFEYPMGNIQMVGKSQAQMFRGEKPVETKLAPEWTLNRIARHAIDFWLSTEDLPMPENRVTVDAEGKLTLRYHATNDTPKKELNKQLHSMLGELHLEPDHLFHRFAYMKNDIPVAGVAHQAGTCRMGDDASTSVVFAPHGAPDGSRSFPTIRTSAVPSRMFSAIVMIASTSSPRALVRSGRTKRKSSTAAASAHATAAAAAAPKNPSEWCHFATRNAPSITIDAWAKFTTLVALKTITNPIAISP